MARYTVELRDIVKSGLKIFDFSYTFYDDTKKADFEQKFIDHFYFREIGVETVGRFQHYLKCKCNERLPYYNELLKITQMQYDVLNPYSVTETMEKTSANIKTSTGNINQNGTTNNTETVNTEKVNTLDSTTEHIESNEIKRDEDIIETGKLDKTSTLDIDGKKVASDTPNGLLAMSDIKNNVYASKADIEDTTNKTVDAQTNSADKKSNSTETTTNTVTDTVDATSGDSLTGTTHNNGSVTNATATTQNENDNGTENYNLHRVGHIGVQTKSELLLKHIELLNKIQTFYTQFFDECEDLFMQIY
jgi:hypothetical protein